MYFMPVSLLHPLAGAFHVGREVAYIFRAVNLLSTQYSCLPFEQGRTKVDVPQALVLKLEWHLHIRW